MCNIELRYTALGDAITGGAMAYFFIGFAYRFCDFLRCKYGCVKCCNFGCPGLTSCCLLKQLKYDCEVKAAVKKSDIITITVGGCNLLKASFEGYQCINRNLAHKWIDRFREDWPKIMYRIRKELCSEAEIYVMNVYNPYCPSDPNYEIADYYICGINSIICDLSLRREYNYNVVDVYCLFEENRDKEWTFFDHIFLKNPNPNWEGNQRIFLAFKDEYCKNNCC